MHSKRRPTLLLAILAALLLLLTSCSSGDDDSSPADGVGDTDSTGDAGESGTDTGDTTESGTDTSGTDDADPVADATALTPSATFPITDGEAINSLAVSPDGATIAVSMQSALGEPVTIRLHDAQTGEAGAETTFDAIGISRLFWMSDGRLVAAGEVDGLWRSWDGATLDELPTQPLEYECRATLVDRIAGYAYSVVDDDNAVCRTDTETGEVVRSADGTVTDVESLWVRPGAAEVLAVHYPDPDPESSAEILTLDGADMTPGESQPLVPGDQIRAVGTLTWIDYFEPRVSLLEPGAVPAPDVRDSLQASTAGTYFVSANGNNDNLYISAADGTVVGTTPAALNPVQFADWSSDDSVMVRLGLDYQIERYEF